MVGGRGSPFVFLISVVLNGLQAALKFLAFITTGSLAVYAEMLHSVSDSVNSSVLYMGASLVNRKPSTKYPFGFVRFPYIASMISLSILVGAIANNILVQAYERMASDPVVFGDTYYGSIPMGGAIAIDLAILLSVYRMRSVWRGFSSKLRPVFLALIIEDLFSLSGNSAAIASLYLSSIYPLADALSSIAITGIILIASGYVIYNNIEILVGRSAPKDLMIKVLNKLSSYKEIVDIDDLKSYALTPDNIFIIATLGVDPRKNVQDLDALKEKITREILSIDTRIKRVVIEFSGEPIDDRDREKIYREISSMEE